MQRTSILIFNLGSLGDTTVSIPAYREIAKRHPGVARYLVTNNPIGTKMVSMDAVLGPMKLTCGTIHYPMNLRNPGDMWQLRKTIAQVRPSILYYLAPEKRRLAMLRHCMFFAACGVRSFRGLPWSKDLRNPREIVSGKLWETEGSRLLRAVGAKVGFDAPTLSQRNLELTESEHATASTLLSSVPTMNEFISVSIGGKFPIKDWGDANWSMVLMELSRKLPKLGLVLVGSSEERNRNSKLAESWSGPSLNACGLLSPRETAAVLARSVLYLGHDTAALHLAAAVSTQIVGVYSSRDLPGKWFSGMSDDLHFYNPVPCFNCLHEAVNQCPNNVACMREHNPETIVNAASKLIQGRLIAA